jgi:hypothetical protein
LGQFFHENHLFFDVFEIITITNGFSILIFFPKHRNHRKPEIFKDLELKFLKKIKELPNTNPYNVYKQLFKKWAWVLPWYNFGFTQFLKRGHNKLMIAQIQCSQGYQKFVEKC